MGEITEEEYIRVVMSHASKKSDKMMKKKGSDGQKYCFSAHKFRVRPKQNALS